MADTRKLNLPGRTSSNPATEPVNSPYSGDLLANVEQASAEDLAHVLDLQQELHRNRSGWLATHQRMDILKKAAAIMEGQSEELALQIAREGGKPLTDARIEVARAINGMELLAAESGVTCSSRLSRS